MMLAVKQGFDEDYSSQSAILGERGLHQILDAGRAWDISHVLNRGGSAIFPHAYLSKCGDQIAAVVHGCLDSGADQVLVLGVIHTRENEQLKQARLQESKGEKITDETHWGVFPEFAGEYSLLHFKTLWDTEVKRRGIKPPKLIMRYPCLVNGKPESLLGIEELERMAKDSVIVITADLVHNGVAYTTDVQLEIGAEAERFTREGIAEMFTLLNQEDYSSFISRCIYFRNDARDPLTVLRYLLGQMQPHLLDLRLVDTVDLFVNDPAPSWVATSLMTLEKSL
ncbi:MAG: hypothetical protein KDK64_01475 [Chlamydiia bacterium]|nr:hypothetical protein [Chlamydiia bacterium]